MDHDHLKASENQAWERLTAASKPEGPVLRKIHEVEDVLSNSALLGINESKGLVSELDERSQQVEKDLEETMGAAESIFFPIGEACEQGFHHLMVGAQDASKAVRSLGDVIDNLKNELLLLELAVKACQVSLEKAKAGMGEGGTEKQ